MQTLTDLIVSRRSQAVGAVRTWMSQGRRRKRLLGWVDWAREHGSLPRISITVLTPRKANGDGWSAVGTEFEVASTGPEMDSSASDLEQAVDRLRTQAGATEQYERLKLTLKQQVEQSIAIARRAVEKAEAELEAAPSHLKAQREHDLRQARERSNEVVARANVIRGKYRI